MKLNIPHSLGRCLIATACLTGALIAPTLVMAQAPQVVLKSTFLTASATVPSDKPAVTYKLKNKKVKIEPGTIKAIPADAKDIKFPEGVLITITTVPNEAGETPRSFMFLVIKDVKLKTLSGEAFEAESSSFRLLRQGGEAQAGQTYSAKGALDEPVDYSAKSAKGIIPEPVPVPFKWPSRSVIFVNSFSVLHGDDVTDGN